MTTKALVSRIILGTATLSVVVTMFLPFIHARQWELILACLGASVALVAIIWAILNLDDGEGLNY
jgi:hypothetical protein